MKRSVAVADRGTLENPLQVYRVFGEIYFLPIWTERPKRSKERRLPEFQKSANTKLALATHATSHEKGRMTQETETSTQGGS